MSLGGALCHITSTIFMILQSGSFAFVKTVLASAPYLRWHFGHLCALGAGSSVQPGIRIPDTKASAPIWQAGLPACPHRSSYGIAAR